MLIADQYRQNGEVTQNTSSEAITVLKRLILGALALMLCLSVLYAPQVWTVYQDFSFQAPVPDEETGVKMGEGYFVPQIR